MPLFYSEHTACPRNYLTLVMHFHLYLIPSKVVVVSHSHLACHHYPFHVRQRKEVLPFHLFVFYSPFQCHWTRSIQLCQHSIQILNLCALDYFFFRGWIGIKISVCTILLEKKKYLLYFMITNYLSFFLILVQEVYMFVYFLLIFMRLGE